MKDERTGATTAMTNELTQSGIRNLLAVANGDKEALEATKDVARDVALRGGEYFAGAAGKEISRALEKSSSMIVRNVAKAEIPAPTIQFVTKGSSIVVKYFRGELTRDECLDGLEELSVTTLGGSVLTGLVAEMAPNACACTVGGIALLPMAATMIGAAISSAIYTGLKSYIERDARIAEQREKLITAQCREACRQLRMYRREIERRFKKSNAAFYNMMATALVDIDSDEVVRSLEGGNSIIRALGYTPMVSSMDDVDRLMAKRSAAPLVIGRC